MKSKNSYYGFLFAFVFIAFGFIMFSKSIIAVGVSSRTQTPSVVGGSLLMFIGCIFLYVGYYGLSPNSKVRSFLEDSPIKKKAPKKTHSKPKEADVKDSQN